MKKTVLVAMVMAFAADSYAQWLTQSAEGKGSYIFKGTNVSFDLLKTDFSFTINNLNDPVKVSSENDNHFFFYGGEINAKSAEGLGNLFSGGYLVPSAGADAYIGFQLANSFNRLVEAEEATLSAQMTKIKNQQFNDFVKRMNDKIDQEILLSLLSDSVIVRKIRREWKESLLVLQPKQFFDFLKTYKPDNATVAAIIPKLTAEVEAINKQNTEGLDHVRTLLVQSREDNIQKKLWRLSIFALGGIDASSFRRIESINTNNFARSFIREDYRGGHLGAGLNFQYNRWKIGATYLYHRTNNFNLLDRTDYKLTSVVTSGNQTLTQERAITAYSGLYGEVDINEFNSDIIYSLHLGGSSNSYALLNAYIRGNFFSRNKELLPNTYNIGFGSYLFTKKSKFLGGLYIELPDVDNYYEKSKPAADQNLRAGLKRLTFGIVGKFSLNSFISQQ
ncbi:MAG: hypothetical protein WKF89_07055 [Chitinophagaceae bacterium]